MPLLREWIHRLLGTLRRGRRDRDLEDELRLHMEMAAEEAHRRGEPLRAASRTAQIRVGSALQAMDALRDQRGLPWLDELSRDLRHGVRALWRTPSFTVVALLTLALGIGANTAIYQLLDAIRIRTLPVKDPEQLVVVELADTTRWLGRRTTGVPGADESAVGAPSRSPARLCGRAGVGQHGPSDRPQHRTSHCTWTLRQRRFLQGARRGGARRTHVHRRRRSAEAARRARWSAMASGSDTSAAIEPRSDGRCHSIERPVEVIGVTSPGFSGVEVGRAFDVAVPICSHAALGGEPGWLGNGTVWWLTVMGRMPAGRSLDVVNGQLDAASPGLFKDSLPANYPPNLRQGLSELHAPRGSRRRGRLGAAKPLCRSAADPAADHGARPVHCLHQSGEPRPRASLCACARVCRPSCGGRLVGSSRPATHGRERVDRVRRSGRRSRRVRWCISRSLVGLLGTGLSLDLPLDLRLMAFMLGVASLACLTFGLIPAWRASRVSAVDAMRATVRSPSGSREGTGLRRALVIAQVACSLRAPLRRTVVHGHAAKPPGR